MFRNYTRPSSCDLTQLVFILFGMKIKCIEIFVI